MSEESNGCLGPTAEQNRAFLAWFEKQQADGRWCLSQPDILKRYAGRVVVVHNRTILGSGRDDLEARDDAFRQAQTMGSTLPAERDLLFLVIPDQAWLDEALLPPHAREQSPLRQ